jgi:hypothetical protein
MAECPVAVGFDPLDPAVLEDPFPSLEGLRSAEPIFFLPALGHYIVTRYEDVEKILMDRTTWSAANASSPLVQLCPAAQRVLDNGFTRVPTLNNADPPRHAPMRKAVLSVMTPSRLRSLEAGLRAYAQDLVLGFRDEPVIDFVERFSFPLASFAGFNLLGFPASDSGILKEWGDTRALLTYGRTPEEDQVAAAEAVLSMWKYVEGHVAARDAEPHEDLTSDLIRLSRERPEQLNEADIVNIIYSMALASQETTSSSLSNGLLALLRNRDQWERLLAEPELIPNATEEILRFDGSVLSHRRVAKVDTKVGEFDVPARSPIMMCFASANHDPVQFGADADDLRVDRQGAERHLAFGRGPHLCLGAPLARLEIRVALELLCALTPRIDLVPGSKHEYSPKALFHDLQSLPVAPQGVAAWRAAGDQLAAPDPSHRDSSRRSVT